MNQSKSTRRQKNNKVVAIIAPKQRPLKRNRNRGSGAGNGEVKITPIGRGLRALGGLAGGLIGQSRLGQTLGGSVARIFGQGDYLTNSDSVMTNSLLSRSGAPSFGDVTDGIRIRHVEYLSDIVSTTVFNTQTLPLNPGLPRTFPWLSKIAANFEEYKFNGLVIYLNTTSGSAVGSTNTALGLWGAVTQYDPSEPGFSTKQQAENYIGCQSSVPSQSLMHGVECKPKSNILDKMYVRTGELGADQDLKFYDWGKTQIFTSGAQASSTIGELKISYDVTFMKPRQPTGGYTAQTDQYYFEGAKASTPIGTGSAQFPVNGSNIGTYCQSDTSNLTFPSSAPEGLYYVCYMARADAAATVSTIALTPSGSMVAYNLFGGNVNPTGSVLYAPDTGTLSRNWMVLASFKKTAATVGLINVVATGLTTGAAHLLVTRVNPNLFTVLNPRTELRKELFTFDELKMLKYYLAQRSLVDANFHEEEEQEIEEQKENSPRRRPAFGSVDVIGLDSLE